jgi:hypothetical protein
MDKFFKIFGWIAGISCFVLITLFLRGSLDSMGVLLYIDFGEEICRNYGRTAEICRDGSATNVSNFFLVFSLILSIGIGNIISERQILPFSSSAHGTRVFAICLITSLSLACVAVTIELIFGRTISKWINGVLGIAVAYYTYRYCDQIVQEHDQTTEPPGYEEEDEAETEDRDSEHLDQKKN